MDDIERVINVHTRILSEENVRRHFEQFGYIMNIYPWTSGSSRHHYFIEFDNVDSVKRVKVDTNRDLTFQYLARNPDMVKRYRSVTSGELSDFQDRKRPREEANNQRYTSSPGEDRYYTTPIHTKRPRLLNEDHSLPRSHFTTPRRIPSYQSNRSPERIVSVGNSDSADYSRHTNALAYGEYSPYGVLPYSSSDTPHWPSDTPLRISTVGAGIRLEGVPSASSNGRICVNPRSVTSASAITNSTLPRKQQPSYSMTCPLPIQSPNVQSMDPDLSPASSYATAEYNPSYPQMFSPYESFSTSRPVISEANAASEAAKTIAALQQASSGLGEWMTAAASFRRKGQHADALEVAKATLTEMRRLNMKDSDMKPALLLIAQSGYSLALESNHANSGSATDEQVTNLFLTAIDWLNKTYGKDESKSKAIMMSSNSQRQPLSSSVAGAKENEVPGSSTSTGKKTPLQRSSDNKNADMGFTAHWELEALKAKHASTLLSLHNIQVNQRETKDALKLERERRNDLQLQVDHLKEELRCSREDADAIRRQTQRESDARRTAEERLALELEAGRRREKELKDETTKLLLRKLAKTFERVAETPSRMGELPNSISGCKEETLNQERSRF